MRTVTQAFADALDGSISPVATVDAWYDGQLRYQGLPLVSGSVEFDASRAIMGSFKATFAGDDPRLDPLAGWDAALACWGSQVQLRAGIDLPTGAQLVSLGWFVISASDPQPRFTPYGMPNGATAYALRGHVVGVEAADRMLLVDDAQLLVPEQPASLASVKAEIARLVQGLVPVGDMSLVDDAAIPGDFAYGQSRTDGLAALCGYIAARPVLAPDGSLTLVPVEGTGEPVLTLTVEHSEVSWQMGIRRDQINNRVVAQGEGQPPPYGVADQTAGALRFGGPFGQRPASLSSPLLKTPDAATKAARTRLAGLTAARAITATIVTRADPRLEVLDVIKVQQPGRTFTGEVRTLAFDLPLSTMKVGLSVPAEQITGPGA